MSFARPTLTDLVTRVRADLNGRVAGADSRLRRSLLDALARTHSGALSGAYGYLDTVAAQVMPDTADSDHLDRWATIWGVGRKVARAASGEAILTGVDGAVVPPGSILLRADGAAFGTTGLVTIADGSATVPVAASDAGTAGDTAAGIALTFASPVTGVRANAVVGGSGIAGGADDEADTLLLGRLLARIQEPPQGGSKSDYLSWALAQPEVTRAWVYPGWMGAGTVGIGVLMDDREDIFPTGDDVAAIANAIELVRPVTAAVTVFSPTPDPVHFTLRITPDTAPTRAAVETEMRELFAREAAPGGTLLMSHMRGAISVAQGVTDYDLLLPGADRTSPISFMPTVGDFTWVGG